VPVPGPVSPTTNCFSRRLCTVFTGAVLWAMHTFVSMAGVPSHDSFVASNCAPGVPMRGPRGASREINAIEVPSLGATL
jgi:hypothetical protein